MADIVLVEGMIEAMKKGESLQEAMVSFYNAGYERDEIEKAARAVQSGQQGMPVVPETPYVQVGENEKMPQQKQAAKTNFRPIPGQPVQRVSAYGDNAESIRKIKEGISGAIERLNQIEFPNGKAPVSKEAIPKPNVSGYGEKPKKRTGAIIAIIIILIVLLGILGGLFIFREQVLEFFDKSGFFSNLFN